MKILAVGMNYSLHVEEMKDILSSDPIIFTKPETALLLNNKPFFYPDFSSEIHYETEIVVRINRIGKSISPRFAHRYYSEITAGIDFTARDIQRKCKEKGLPWDISKAFDNSAPVGRMLAKTDFADVNRIRFRLDLNGNTVQEGNTADMIFSIDRIIAHVSEFFTLKTGDLIFTGTPNGVGPVQIGDRLQAYIENEQVMDFYVR
ncbi:MAG: fumarylacetoacetate hydrolase family protein [Bacteroidales bacterium]|jgi:2-keto-4-pentenoate hydratase/2-oxohepta-3-ene-1,7-dioic acid hydratase in catechol pathway|nr:fumarylacetoacetate hydrolase family protein [Bacteroidales bacterium]